MPDILSQDEIDALLTATGSPESGGGGGGGGREVKAAAAPIKPVVTYDFKHPNRVSKDQIRTLENIHSSLARNLAASFSNLQRAVVDADIAFVDQTTCCILSIARSLLSGGAHALAQSLLSLLWYSVPALGLFSLRFFAPGPADDV